MRRAYLHLITFLFLKLALFLHQLHSVLGHAAAHIILHAYVYIQDGGRRWKTVEEARMGKICVLTSVYMRANLSIVAPSNIRYTQGKQTQMSKKYADQIST